MAKDSTKRGNEGEEIVFKKLKAGYSNRAIRTGTNFPRFDMFVLGKENGKICHIEVKRASMKDAQVNVNKRWLKNNPKFNGDLFYIILDCEMRRFWIIDYKKILEKPQQYIRTYGSPADKIGSIWIPEESKSFPTRNMTSVLKSHIDKKIK